MRTRRWVAGAGVGSLLLAGVVTGGPLVSASFQDASPAAKTADDDVANATPVVGTPLLEPAIDLRQAQEAALAGQDGAAVASVKLDGDEGTLTYDVVLDTGLEVEVDATTGEIGETEQADGDDEDAETDDDAGEAENGDDAGEADGDDGEVDDGEVDDGNGDDQDEPGDVDGTDDAEGEGDDA